jgi:hypothetical protein
VSVRYRPKEVEHVDGHGDKRLRIGGFEYTVDESADGDIVAQIRAALSKKTVVEVPVLDEKQNRMTLYINGAQVDAMAIDPEDGIRPGELSP